MLFRIWYLHHQNKWCINAKKISKTLILPNFFVQYPINCDKWQLFHNFGTTLLTFGTFLTLFELITCSASQRPLQKVVKRCPLNTFFSEWIKAMNTTLPPWSWNVVDPKWHPASAPMALSLTSCVTIVQSNWLGKFKYHPNHLNTMHFVDFPKRDNGNRHYKWGNP